MKNKLTQYFRDRLKTVKKRNEELINLRDFVLLKYPEVFNEYMRSKCNA